MTPEVFEEWVRIHCEHTGADSAVALTLVANRDIIVSRWRATYAEICECSTRLIEAGRTPKFANEHMDALKSELDRLRVERADAAKSAQQRASVPGCGCAACNGGVADPEWVRQRNRLRAFLVAGVGCSPPRGRNR